MSTFRLCSRCKTEGRGYQRCKRCKAVFYCSKVCQSEDWPSHRPICRRLNASNSRPVPRRGHSPAGRYGTGDISTRQLAALNELGPYVIQYRRPRPLDQEPESGIVKGPAVTASDNSVDAGLSQVVQYLTAQVPNSCTVLTQLDDVPHEWFLEELLPETVIVVKIVALDKYWIRHGIWVEDELKQRVVVYFYLDNDCPFPCFQWEELKPGSYVGIFDPTLHLFTDHQIGFRINMAEQVRVFCGCHECIDFDPNFSVSGNSWNCGEAAA